MNKEELAKEQPVVCDVLQRACEQNRISGAWLFYGPQGTPKRQTAVLLAQSILCRNRDGLACGVCDTCRRTAAGLHPDVIILDGSEKGISKADIDAVQERFSRTSLEDGERVYIVVSAENASIAAQNSMLKFLEEPGRGVTAILTSDNIGRLLPTIVSRCTLMPFLPMKQEDRMKAAEEEGIPAEDAYFLSHMAREREDLLKVYESGEYEKAVMMLKQYLNLEGLKRAELLVDYDISYRAQFSDRQKAKEANMRLLNGFFDLLLMYARDMISPSGYGPGWYRALKPEKDVSDYGRMIILISEQRDKVNKYNDLNLLMDQTFFRMEELQ